MYGLHFRSRIVQFRLYHIVQWSKVNALTYQDAQAAQLFSKVRHPHWITNSRIRKFPYSLWMSQIPLYLTKGCVFSYTTCSDQVNKYKNSNQDQTRQVNIPNRHDGHDSLPQQTPSLPLLWSPGQPLKRADYLNFLRTLLSSHQWETASFLWLQLVILTNHSPNKSNTYTPTPTLSEWTFDQRRKVLSEGQFMSIPQLSSSELVNTLQTLYINRYYVLALQVWNSHAHQWQSYLYHNSDSINLKNQVDIKEQHLVQLDPSHPIEYIPYTSKSFEPHSNSNPVILPYLITIVIRILDKMGLSQPLCILYERFIQNLTTSTNWKQLDDCQSNLLYSFYIDLVPSPFVILMSIRTQKHLFLLFAKHAISIRSFERLAKIWMVFRQCNSTQPSILNPLLQYLQNFESEQSSTLDKPQTDQSNACKIDAWKNWIQVEWKRGVKAEKEGTRLSSKTISTIAKTTIMKEQACLEMLENPNFNLDSIEIVQTLFHLWIDSSWKNHQEQAKSSLTPNVQNDKTDNNVFVQKKQSISKYDREGRDLSCKIEQLYRLTFESALPISIITRNSLMWWALHVRQDPAMAIEFFNDLQVSEGPSATTTFTYRLLLEALHAMGDLKGCWEVLQSLKLGVVTMDGTSAMICNNDGSIEDHGGQLLIQYALHYSLDLVIKYWHKKVEGVSDINDNRHHSKIDFNIFQELIDECVILAPKWYLEKVKPYLSKLKEHKVEKGERNATKTDICREYEHLLQNLKLPDMEAVEKYIRGLNE